MSLFNLHCVTDTKFDVVNVEKSVQESLVSKLVMSQPDMDDAGTTDVLLPVDQVVRLMKTFLNCLFAAANWGS